MTVVVTGNCQRCRFTDCVVVCPTDAFHGDAEMLYIDPEACIDCGGCIPECPVEALFDEDDLPPELEKWKAINAEKVVSLPVIAVRAEPFPGARERKKMLGF